MKPKIRSFFDECWQSNIWLIWPVRDGQTVVDAIRHQFGIEVESDDDFGGQCYSLRHPECGSLVQCIVLKQWDHDPMRLSILAHECFHAAESILENAGLPHNAQTSEAYAHLTGSIFRRCLRLLAGKKAHEEWD